MSSQQGKARQRRVGEATKNEKAAPIMQTPAMRRQRSAKILSQRESFSGDFLLAISTVLLMGLAFGFAMNKGRVFEPIVIQQQFQFTKWVMMKMFLAASGTSGLCLSVVSMMASDHFAYARDKYVGCNNAVGAGVGALILGGGMAIAGACPGMVLIQTGAGVPNSLYTVGGCLVGALTYGLVEPFIRDWVSPANCTIPTFLDGYLRKSNYSAVAFFVGLLLLGISFVIEFIVPWTEELTTPNADNCDLMHCRSWPPILAGIMVGSLQVPCLLILGNTLGGASSYVCVMGQWLRFCPEKVQNFFPHIKSQLNRWWQVAYVLFAIVGSAAAVVSGGGKLNFLEHSFDDIQGIEPSYAMIGGFLMIFGSRMAKGCTSGHGLSGMALLNLSSMLAVPAMFVGGGIASLLM